MWEKWNNFSKDKTAEINLDIIKIMELSDKHSKMYINCESWNEGKHIWKEKLLNPKHKENNLKASRVKH